MEKKELYNKLRGCNSFVDFYKFKQDILDALEPPKKINKKKTEGGL